MSYNASDATDSTLLDASDELASDARSSIGAKCGGMAVMFLLPLLFGLIPLKAIKMRNAARFTSIASCFGGGVFFGTCFMHLIPEVALEINLWKSRSDSDLMKALPLAEILECVGFIAILLVECVVHSVSSEGHGHGNLTEEELTNLDSERRALKSNGAGESSTNGEIQENSKKHNKSVGVLIFALAVHSVFEGLAIGVEARTSVFLQLAGAILIHKCVVAFAVGTRLIEAGLRLKGMCLNLGIFCISTPIGIAVAMGILETLSTGTATNMALVSGIIQGLSTGFFLYITFAEMIFDEMRDGKDLLLKVVFLTLGTLLIGISTVLHNYSDIVAQSSLLKEAVTTETPTPISGLD